MINRLLVIAVIILSFGIAGATGCITAEPNSSPKYTQQQIADMQAELEEIEAALTMNEEQQKDTQDKIWSYETQQAVYTVFLLQDYRLAGINPQSAVDTSTQLLVENRAKLQELQAQHQELFERKILLMVKLEATQE